MAVMDMAQCVEMHAEPASATALAPYRGRNRVVVVLAPERLESDVKDQMYLLQRERRSLEERDVILLTAIGSREPSLRHYFETMCDIRPEQFAVLMIGKDGGVKMHRNRPVTAKEITQIIDAMPMRRQEMRLKAGTA